MMSWAIRNYKVISKPKQNRVWIPKQKPTDPQNTYCPGEINAKLAAVDSYLSSFSIPNTASMLTHQTAYSTSLQISQIDSYLEAIADRVLGKAPSVVIKSCSDSESNFEKTLYKFNLDSRLSTLQQKNLSNLLMLANRRKERAQIKGTTCSIQCPKCQLLFLF